MSQTPWVRFDNSPPGQPPGQPPRLPAQAPVGGPSRLRRPPPPRRRLPGLDDVDYNVVKNSYRFEALLGKGSYSSVYRAVDIKTRKPVAIKVSKDGVGYSVQGSIDNENELIKLVMETPHRNILEFLGVIDFKERSYVISEYTEMGDLFSLLQVTNSHGLKVWKPLREIECWYIIKGVAQGLSHLHKMSIAHGDLKPHNILMFANVEPTPQDRPNITRYDRMLPKICDLGSAAMRQENDPEGKIMMDTPSCTITYAAPESYFTKKDYDMIRADYYSLGNCLINMVLGAQSFEPPVKLPRRSDPEFQTKMDVYRRYLITLKKDIKYVESLCIGLGQQIGKLLLRILEPFPDNRMTVEKFLRDPWITDRKASEAEVMSQRRPHRLNRKDKYQSKEWN